MGTSETPKTTTPEINWRCETLYLPAIEERDFVADFRLMSERGINGKRVMPPPTDEYVDTYIKDSRFYKNKDIEILTFDWEHSCVGEDFKQYAAVVDKYIGPGTAKTDCAMLEREIHCLKAGPPFYSVVEDPSLQNFEKSTARMNRNGEASLEVAYDAALPDDHPQKQFSAEMCILSAMTAAGLFPNTKLFCDQFGAALVAKPAEPTVAASDPHPN